MNGDFIIYLHEYPGTSKETVIRARKINIITYFGGYLICGISKMAEDRRRHWGPLQ